MAKALSMKDLPSFIGPKVHDKDMLRFSSQYHPILIVMDTTNIQALMSTAIMVTLTLAELLKVKPELWNEITFCLGKMGALIPKFKSYPINKEINQENHHV